MKISVGADSSYNWPKVSCRLHITLLSPLILWRITHEKFHWGDRKGGLLVMFHSAVALEVDFAVKLGFAQEPAIVLPAKSCLV